MHHSAARGSSGVQPPGQAAGGGGPFHQRFRGRAGHALQDQEEECKGGDLDSRFDS